MMINFIFASEFEVQFYLIEVRRSMWYPFTHTLVHEERNLKYFIANKFVEWIMAIDFDFKAIRFQFKYCKLHSNIFPKCSYKYYANEVVIFDGGYYQFRFHQVNE